MLRVDEERGKWTSASAAEADALCPGRHQACLGVPEPEASPEASSGTRIHAWLAGEDVELNADEREIADRCKMAKETFLTEWAGPDSSYMQIVEQRIWHTFQNGIKHSGKGDLVCINQDDGRACILDYKTGRNEVAENVSNLQLRDLAVLVAWEFCVSEVTVKIIQPLVHDQPACVYTAQDLVKAAEEMELRVTTSNSPFAPRVAGEKQCKYCRAKAKCQEFLASGLPAELPQMPAEGWNDPIPFKEKFEQSIANLSGVRLGAVLTMTRMVAEVAEAETRQRLNAGQTVDGWKMTEGRTTEKITDPQKVFARFVEKGGTPEQFMPAVTLAKGKLKDAVKAVTGEKGKALETSLDALLDGCVEAKQSAPSLVKE